MRAPRFHTFAKGAMPTWVEDKLAPLHQNLFIETSPAPVKFGMSLIGKCSENVRLPMVPASEKARVAVREAMVHAGLIN